jgi:hypothetical protein
MYFLKELCFAFGRSPAHSLVVQFCFQENSFYHGIFQFHTYLTIKLSFSLHIAILFINFVNLNRCLSRFD